MSMRMLQLPLRSLRLSMRMKVLHSLRDSKTRLTKEACQLVEHHLSQLWHSRTSQQLTLSEIQTKSMTTGYESHSHR